MLILSFMFIKEIIYIIMKKVYSYVLNKQKENHQKKNILFRTVILRIESIFKIQESMPFFIF